MIIHNSLVVAEAFKRGRKFATEVLKAGTKQGGNIEIDERDWLIACERWPVKEGGLRTEEPHPCC